MPVIWVLLLRHARLINLAKTVPLDRRELELCETTLYVVLAFTDKRVDTLAGLCRSRVFVKVLTYPDQRASDSRV